jgi:hypothetical protein
MRIFRLEDEHKHFRSGFFLILFGSEVGKGHLCNRNIPNLGEGSKCFFRQASPEDLDIPP